jgi:topoisomerase-4 subunit A
MEERADLDDLLADETCNGRIASAARGAPDLRQGQIRGRSAPHQFAEAGEVEEVPLEAMIDREPVTVVCSKMGWIRAMRGHIDLDAGAEVQATATTGRFIFHAETTDKLLLVGSNGRVLHAAGGQPARWARHGRAVRLMVDLPNEAEIVALFVHRPGAQAAWWRQSAGDGFIVPEDDVVAQTRRQAGPQRAEGVKALFCRARLTGR